MPRIEWSDRFSVGHDEIDKQHQKWVAIHNKLHETMLSGSDSDVCDATTATLEEMNDYIKVHFSFEEEYQQSINFSEYDKHLKIHRSFESLVEGYIQDIKKGSLVLNSEIMRILKDWLQNHILKDDMKFSKVTE